MSEGGHQPGLHDPFADLPVLAELRERLAEHFEAELRQEAGERSRRRRRWRLSLRARPALALMATLAAAGSAAAAVSLSVRRSQPLSGRVPSAAAGALTPQLGFSEGGRRYRIAFAPVLSAGEAGWRSVIAFGAHEQHSEVGEGTGYPTAERLVLAGEDAGIATPGSLGEKTVHYVLTGPSVAALGVGGQTVETRTSSGLPSGDRAAVFLLPADETPVISVSVPERDAPPAGFRPPPVQPTGAASASASGRQLSVVPLDRSGLPIGIAGSAAPAARLAVRAWHRGGAAAGACALQKRGAPALEPQWGKVVMAVHPIHNAVGELLLSCLETTYSLHGAPLHAAILLNSRHPGQAPPGPIPGGQPVAGHPGTVNVVLGPVPGDITARRAGDAWLVVQGGRSLAQRLEALAALRVTKT